jgi:hypothetical protein
MAHKPPAHQVAYDSGRGVAIHLNFGNVSRPKRKWPGASRPFIRPRNQLGLARDAKKWLPVFRKNPALCIGIDHVYGFGSIRSKLIVI